MLDTITKITDMDALEAIYGQAVQGSIDKVVQSMTPHYARWIRASKFLVLSTVGPEGTDASPRGDAGPVVEIFDETRLILPDWQGNNRIDSLRNILRDGRVSLMFMVAGSNNVVRVNGTAILSADRALTKRFERKGKLPRTVILVTIGEMYFQCAKAMMRSELWGDTPKADVPSAGDFLKEHDAGFDGSAYDEGYREKAIPRYW